MRKIVITSLTVIVILVTICLTTCSKDKRNSDKPVETSSATTTTLTTISPVVTTTIVTVESVPVVTTTGESGYVPSTSLTQGTTSNVTTTTSSKVDNTTTKATTTKKPSTVTTTTIKKTTTKTTTTTKKTTTTAKTTTKVTTTTKATTTTASYVPFKTPVEFEYDETNNVYRATMNDGSIIVWTKVYRQLHIYDVPDTENYTTFKSPSFTPQYPAELTLYGKTKDGKYYYASAVWYDGTSSFTGYIPVDTEAFIDVYFDYDAAYEIFELINKERVKAGVEPLEYDYNLEKYAMFRSSELYIDFSHYSPASTAAENLKFVKQYVYKYNGSHNENIYQLRCDGYLMDYTLPSATKINQCWVDSSGHYATMVGSSWTYVGVGVYRTEKGTFAVQVFGDGEYMDNPRELE